MKFSRLVRLALGELGDAPYKKWAVLFCLSFVCGAALIIAGTASGLKNIIETRILGGLPEIIRVQPEMYSLGPLRNESFISENTAAAISSWPGVKHVFRQAPLERPCSFHASYAGQHFYSDVAVEALEDEMLRRFCSESGYEEPESSDVIDCVLPGPTVEALLAGVSLHTDLPGLSTKIVYGRHFDITAGKSSISSDRLPHRRLRCRAASISPLVGLGGPTIPLSLAAELNAAPLRFNALIIEAEQPSDVPGIVERLPQVRLRAPGAEMAAKIGRVWRWVHLGIAVFCALLLMCAGTALYSSLSLEIRSEIPKLALYRALGASASDLGLMYVIRSLCLGLIGAVTGLTVGMIGGGIVNSTAVKLSLIDGTDELIFQPGLEISAVIAFSACLFSVLFAWLPVRRLCRLSTVMGLASLNR